MSAKLTSPPDHDTLYQIAEAQAGYFTTGQAATAGFSYGLISHHVRAGLFERICSGVYRLRRFPASPHEDLFIAWLRAGMHAVLSHDSALALYELSDLMPDAVHLTVPRTTSRRHPGIRLHTNRLNSEDVTRYLGLPVTTVARTIADVANSGLSQELVEQAIAEALQRGLTTVHDLRQTTSRRKGRAASIVAQVLQTRSQP
jgi:predicted transcriptional regulator of viral defense system